VGLEYPKFAKPILPSAVLRYLGAYDEISTPYANPRLRLHVVKDQEPMILRIYNDSFESDKIVLRALVNKCKLAEISEAEVTNEIKAVARDIFWYTDLSVGW